MLFKNYLILLQKITNMNKLKIDEIPLKISLVSYDGVLFGYEVTLPSGISKRFYFEYGKEVTLTQMFKFIEDFISRLKHV